ncbi:MAG TPA: 50S ribosomal protein L30 [Clostridia bacterium]|jgi:large subunit ribosomal protein L30|nr:50S ribosomal protein L30 [Clostridia bacterium]
MADTKLKITLVNSPIGSNKKQKATLEALGLRKLNHAVVKDDSPEIRGMVEKIKHLLVVETLEA